MKVTVNGPVEGLASISRLSETMSGNVSPKWAWSWVSGATVALSDEHAAAIMAVDNTAASNVIQPGRRTFLTLALPVAFTSV